MAEAQVCGVEATSAPLMQLWRNAHEQCAACVKLRFDYKSKEHGGRLCEKLRVFILESDHSPRAVNMKCCIDVHNYILDEVKWIFSSGRLEGTPVSGDKAVLILTAGIDRGVWSYWGSGCCISGGKSLLYPLSRRLGGPQGWRGPFTI